MQDEHERTAHLGAGGSEMHRDRKSTRLNSSHSQISYAVFCLKKKKITFTSSTPRIAPSMPTTYLPTSRQTPSHTGITAQTNTMPPFIVGNLPPLTDFSLADH